MIYNAAMSFILKHWTQEVASLYFVAFLWLKQEWQVRKYRKPDPCWQLGTFQSPLAT